MNTPMVRSLPSTKPATLTGHPQSRPGFVGRVNNLTRLFLSEFPRILPANCDFEDGNLFRVSYLFMVFYASDIQMTPLIALSEPSPRFSIQGFHAFVRQSGIEMRWADILHQIPALTFQKNKEIIQEHKGTSCKRNANASKTPKIVWLWQSKWSTKKRGKKQALCQKKQDASVPKLGSINHHQLSSPKTSLAATKSGDFSIFWWKCSQICSTFYIYLFSGSYQQHPIQEIPGGGGTCRDFGGPRSAGKFCVFGWKAWRIQLEKCRSN